MSNKTDPVQNGVQIRRIGLDFGRVIAEILGPDGKKFGLKKYHLRPEVAGAIEGIKILVTYLGDDNVFIIRNGFGPTGGVKRQKLAILKTWQWFRRNQFFERTGMKRENVLFPNSREGKQHVCEEKRITDLVEDRAEVAQHLSGVRWYAFRPEPAEIKRFIAEATAETISTMVVVQSWSELLDFMRKSFDPASNEESGGLSPAERAAWKRVHEEQKQAVAGEQVAVAQATVEPEPTPEK